MTERSSARSHASRHTWRSGLIPPCTDPPYRIPSDFPLPRATLSQVPGLNHPDLNRGQRRYLYSTAQIYSMDSAKKALSDSYYGLLMGELYKGGGQLDSHKRYTVWIYGNHKRLYETNPKIWRSTSRRSRREREAAAFLGAEQKQDEPRPDGGEVEGKSRPTRKSARPMSAKQRQAPTEAPAQRASPRSPSPQPQLHPSKPSQTAGVAHSARKRNDSANVVNHMRPRQPPTPPASRSAAGSRGSNRAAASANKNRSNRAATDANRKDDEDEVEECVDNQRPRDLNKILY